MLIVGLSACFTALSLKLQMMRPGVFLAIHLIITLFVGWYIYLLSHTFTFFGMDICSPKIQGWLLIIMWQAFLFWELPHVLTKSKTVHLFVHYVSISINPDISFCLFLVNLYDLMLQQENAGSRNRFPNSKWGPLWFPHPPPFFTSQ